MSKRLFLAVLLFTVFVLEACSIENAFPDDKLDYYWRLDRIEYKGGVNFFGDSCDKEDIENTMFGFARHMVVIEDLSRDFTRHGVTSEMGDSIKMDFSMYEDDSLQQYLCYSGLDNVVTTFKKEFPDKNHLILSNAKAILRLRKW